VESKVTIVGFLPLQRDSLMVVLKIVMKTLMAIFHIHNIQKPLFAEKIMNPSMLTFFTIPSPFPLRAVFTRVFSNVSQTVFSGNA
jgi:hypothetical protein